jgi:hypothetical protein
MFTISQKWLARILAVSVLALWFAFIFAGNSIGVFQPRPNELPINLLLASLTPVAIFAVSYIGWAGFRRFVLSLDLRLITIFQSWRVLGGGILFLYAYNVLPGIFALPAGWGDVAIGVAAPFYAMALIAGKALPKRAFVTWNILGIFDFVLAATLAILASPGPLGILAGEITTEPLLLLPLSLIPTFLVPLFIILHLIGLILVARKTEARSQEPVKRSVIQTA